MSEKAPAVIVPTHPWQSLHDRLPEGKGNFYHFGPNYTVDPIVLSNNDSPSILLIQRDDTGEWALPGGFIDEDIHEEAIDAGIREVEEETGLILESRKPEFVYEGPVDDPRSTLNAWPETTALLWRVDSEEPVVANDDARFATWIPLSSLPDALYGSHAMLIKKAIDDHGTLYEQLAYYDNQAEVTKPSGGHMGYERTIISLPNHKRVFMKRHMSNYFTDEERERHSRDYLVKEFSVYQQLGAQTPHIAQCHELIDDHSLVLEAYDYRDGWNWRAPDDPTLQEHYISDILDALGEIEHVSFCDTSTIPAAHESLEHDGWDMYPKNREAIMSLLALHDTPDAQLLSERLDTLYHDHQHSTARPLSSFTHADLRQSNVAWHPKHGVRIVDWSWAGPGAPGMDTTSFLIDLAKSGVDVDAYTDNFDSQHACTLIGFWLGRAILPTASNTGVREHQLASAIAAHGLLVRHQPYGEASGSPLSVPPR